MTGRSGRAKDANGRFLPKFAPISIGDKFGRLLVVGIEPKRRGDAEVRCRCDCGNERTIRSTPLRNRAQSCGCLGRERASAQCLARATHGHARSGAATRTYRTWENMIRRCYSVKCRNYSGYGGRGITVCDRWRDSFANFLADMGERPEGLTLDRRDNNGNYTPDNCRWATLAQQRKNQSTPPRFTPDGAREAHRLLATGLRVFQVAKMLGVTYSTIHSLKVGTSWRLASLDPPNGDPGIDVAAIAVSITGAVGR